MSMRRPLVLALGPVGGLAVGLIAVGSARLAGGALGVAVGVLAAALAGGLGAWLLGERLARAAAARLAALGGDDREAAGPTGWAALDGELESLGRDLGRLREATAALERLERAAEPLCRAAGLAGPPERGLGLDRGATATAWVEALRDLAARLSGAIGPLGELTLKIASGARDQSENVEQTTTTVEALYDRIDRISQSAQDANAACERTRQEARSGLEQVQALVSGMERLHSHVDLNAGKARRLGERLEEIGTIVETIDEVAKRTDMLALNATIESVRAGEHGRGFAVVAEEIRKLAERAGAATREIGNLVGAIRADAHESIHALSEEHAQMEQETRRIRQAGAALSRISQVAEDSAGLVEAISVSANDQVVATQGLVRCMQRVSETARAIRGDADRARLHVQALEEVCEPSDVPAPAGRSGTRGEVSGTASPEAAVSRPVGRGRRAPSAVGQP